MVYVGNNIYEPDKAVTKTICLPQTVPCEFTIHDNDRDGMFCEFETGI